MGADVLAQLKVLEEAEAKRLEVIRRGAMEEFVIPAIDQQLAFLDRAEGIFPLLTTRERAAFDDATAGKAQKSGMHVRQRLHHVSSQTTRTILPRVPGEK